MEVIIKKYDKYNNVTFVFDWEESIGVDSEFADQIHMNLEDYQNLMIEKFNAQIHQIGEICFENYKDAEKAKEWYDSQLLAYTLAGDNYEL